MPKAIVVGDLHLRNEGDPRPAEALSRLLAAEPDATLVFAGDALDLAAEPVSSAGEAARRTLGRAPELSRTLAERAGRGVRTVFVAGNHDAEVGRDETIQAIHEALGLAPEHRQNVVGVPWFYRLAEGAVHVEHGHVFDPDGAPTHPLAPVPRDDVGIAILRKFIVPVEGHFLVAHNAEAPLPLLTRVIRTYGPRAPWVIYLYIRTALGTWLSSGDSFPIEVDRAEGARRLSQYAAEVGLDHETLSLLLDAHATPTRARRTATFLRLYLDRVIATSAVLSGATMSAAGMAVGASVPVMAGVPLATVGALALSASILAGANRYHGRAEQALKVGAERAAEITGARTVVLGHVHVDSSGPRYRNTASFAFAPGHPYLVVEEDGSVARGHAAIAV